MARLKRRSSTDWVDTNLSGTVRYGGQTISFSPPTTGDVLEPVQWPNPPSLLNGDDATNYNMGLNFSVLKPGVVCAGVQWHVPTTVVAPAGGVIATLWQLSPNIRVRMQVITPTPGTVQDFLWDEGDYVFNEDHPHTIGIYTRNYSFRSAGGNWGFTNANADISALVGRLSVGWDPDNPPGSNFDSYYYISPLIRV